MKLAASLLLLPSTAMAFISSDVSRGTSATSSKRMSEEAADEPIVAAETTVASQSVDLIGMSEKLNPIVGYWDPLTLGTADFWDEGNDATVGFLRQAEIKHGRVAMAAFVGYCVQSNYVFPWANTLAGDPFPSVDLSPEQQWDALPENARWQIIFVIGLLEIWDEAMGGDPERKHYMKGGRPGDYPSFDLFRDQIHPVLDLYDPFGYTRKLSRENKDRRLLMEVNNGRLAMLGIFGFLCADTIEGSVPALKDIAIAYDGQVMAPFAADGSFF